MAKATRGDTNATRIFQIAHLKLEKDITLHFKGMCEAYWAECALWNGDFGQCHSLAEDAMNGITYHHSAENEILNVMRLQAEAALRLGDTEGAEKLLQEALARSRAIDLIELEISISVALAESYRRKREFSVASELLEQIWAPAERGPYPLFHANAMNVLAQIERDQGNREAAIAAATRAYRLAWCEGPPFACHYGLTNARKHLQELGAADPRLPPFDASKFEPMPDVELNPKDEFWVDPATLDSDN